MQLSIPVISHRPTNVTMELGLNLAKTWQLRQRQLHFVLKHSTIWINKIVFEHQPMHNLQYKITKPFFSEVQCCTLENILIKPRNLSTWRLKLQLSSGHRTSLQVKRREQEELVLAKCVHCSLTLQAEHFLPNVLRFYSRNILKWTHIQMNGFK